MGGKQSHSVAQNDNSAQINQNLSNIRDQLNSLSSDIHLYKTSIHDHVVSVENKFHSIDKKIFEIQDSFDYSIQQIDFGLETIKSNIDNMAKCQIEYENNNQHNLWLIMRNDWKTEYKQHITNEYNKLHLCLLENKSLIQQKIVCYLLNKDEFNDKLKLQKEKQTNIQISTMQQNIQLLSSHLNSPTDSFELTLIKQEEIIEIERNIPPELETGLKDTLLIVDRFKELNKMKDLLQEDVVNKMNNFNNITQNPLSIPKTELYKRLIRGKIFNLDQITIDNQDDLLSKNGFSYIPEYKYQELIDNYIGGVDIIDLDIHNINTLYRIVIPRIDKLTMLDIHLFFMQNKSISNDKKGSILTVAKLYTEALKHNTISEKLTKSATVQQLYEFMVLNNFHINYICDGNLRRYGFSEIKPRAVMFLKMLLKNYDADNLKAYTDVKIRIINPNYELDIEKYYSLQGQFYHVTIDPSILLNFTLELRRKLTECYTEIFPLEQSAMWFQFSKNPDNIIIGDTSVTIRYPHECSKLNTLSKTYTIENVGSIFKDNNVFEIKKMISAFFTLIHNEVFE